MQYPKMKNQEKLQRIRPTVLSGPAVALWEITSRCSHKCAGCANVFPHDGYDVSLADFGKGLSRLRGYVRDVRLTGGEPTLHPELTTILDLLEDEGVAYSILSNGLWSAPDAVLESVTDRPHFKGFLVSLHGHTAAIHDHFVGVDGSFKTVTGCISLATAAGFYVSTNTILHRGVISHSDDMAELSRSLGATYAVFNRYYGAPAQHQISPDELRRIASHITSERFRGKMMRLGNCVPKCAADCDCDGCPGGNYIITIDPWLNARPCNHAPSVAGSLRNSALSEIWRGPAMEQWRQLVPDQCPDCCHRDECAGGCRAEGLLKGVECDPLVQPVAHLRTSATRFPLKLYRQQQFGVACSRVPQEFGEMLFFEGEVAVLNWAGVSVLDDLTSGLPLARLLERHGDDTVSLVAELLLSGFIEYVD